LIVTAHEMGEELRVSFVPHVVKDFIDGGHRAPIQRSPDAFTGLHGKLKPIHWFLDVALVRPQALILGDRQDNGLWFAAMFHDHGFVRPNPPEYVSEMDTRLGGAHRLMHVIPLTSSSPAIDVPIDQTLT